MHLLRVLAVVAVATFLVTNFKVSAQAKFPIQTPEIEKKEGSTTVKGSAKISKQKDKILIEAKLWVRKSGQTGVGYGKVQFVFLDKDGNTLYKSPVVSEQVGAKVPEGTKDKTKTQDIEDVPLDKVKDAENVVVVVMARDTDWKNNDELNEAIDKFVGDLKNKMKDPKSILKELIPLK